MKTSGLREFTSMTFESAKQNIRKAYLNVEHKIYTELNTRLYNSPVAAGQAPEPLAIGRAKSTGTIVQVIQRINDRLAAQQAEAGVKVTAYNCNGDQYFDSVIKDRQVMRWTEETVKGKLKDELNVSIGPGLTACRDVCMTYHESLLLSLY